MCGRLEFWHLKLSLNKSLMRKQIRFKSVDLFAMKVARLNCLSRVLKSSHRLLRTVGSWNPQSDLTSKKLRRSSKLYWLKCKIYPVSEIVKQFILHKVGIISWKFNVQCRMTAITPATGGGVESRKFQDNVICWLMPTQNINGANQLYIFIYINLEYLIASFQHGKRATAIVWPKAIPFK